MGVCVWFLFLAYLVSGHNCFTWDDNFPDGHVIHACVGSDVTFEWAYTLGPQESVTSTDWTFKGGSQEMVAMSSHGTFMVLPAFSQRVQAATNGGFTLTHVTKGDSGNYSVEINGQAGPGLSLYQRKTATLVVQDSTSDGGQLQVTKSHTPVHDDVSDSWTVELSCGNFSFVGSPPFQVQWTLPSGQVVQSTSYHDNQFHLLVPTPLEGGRYRCQIPSQARPLLCLEDGHATPQADVMLDGPLTRLTLMEAEQTSLRQQNRQVLQLVEQLRTDNQHLKADNHELRNEVQQLKVAQQQDHATLIALTSGIPAQQAAMTSALTSQVQQLEMELQHMNATMCGAPVAFQLASNGTHIVVTADEGQVLFPTVEANVGNAYNEQTGLVQAPVAGWYLLLAEVGIHGESGVTKLELMKNDVIQASTEINNSAAFARDEVVMALNALLHLEVNDQVWLKLDINSTVHHHHYQLVADFTSTFIGVLIH